MSPIWLLATDPIYAYQQVLFFFKTGYQRYIREATLWPSGWRFHARLQEFLTGDEWAGGSRSDCQKTALTTFFPSPYRILQFYSGLSMVYFGSNFSRVGVQMFISIDTHRISESVEPALMPEPSLKPSENILHNECTCS